MLISRLEIIAEHFIGANNLFLYKFKSAKNLLHFHYLELSLIPSSFYLSAVSRIYCGINFLKKEGVALGKTMQEQWMDQCVYLIFVISFTQAAFSNSKFYTQKLTKNTPKH